MPRTTLEDRLAGLNMPIVDDSRDMLAWQLAGHPDVTAIYDPRAVANGFVLKLEGTLATGSRLDFGFTPTGQIARAVMNGEFIADNDAEAVFCSSLCVSD
jgi:hypothetical protein